MVSLPTTLWPADSWQLGSQFVYLTLPPLGSVASWAFCFAGESHSAFQQAQFGNAES